MYRILILVILAMVISCNEKQASNNAEMYEASELAATMRQMVEFSKYAKNSLENGGSIDSIPNSFWRLSEMQGTRDEQKESDFQNLVLPYLEALKGIERGDSDSQAYYYKQSIQACKSCHSVYCGGPMAIINQLD